MTLSVLVTYVSSEEHGGAAAGGGVEGCPCNCHLEEGVEEGEEGCLSGVTVGLSQEEAEEVHAADLD